VHILLKSIEDPNPQYTLNYSAYFFTIYDKYSKRKQILHWLNEIATLVKF
jgi:hypothetical protein